jgi:3-hydroxyisobutyrate dehydrogenase-like beta-hydroxyacid dehydrogenase
VACPVFGTPAMAEGGQLVCMLARPKEDVEEVVPYCKGVIGRANIDFGGQPTEKATLLKVIGNTFILSMVETISEGQVVAEKTGLGVDILHQFFEVMFLGLYAAYSNQMKAGDYYKREDQLFAVDLVFKRCKACTGIGKQGRCAHEERGDSKRIPEGCQGAHECARRYRRNLRCEKS